MAGAPQPPILSAMAHYWEIAQGAVSAAATDGYTRACAFNAQLALALGVGQGAAAILVVAATVAVLVVVQLLIPKPKYAPVMRHGKLEVRLPQLLPTSARQYPELAVSAT